MIDTFPTVRATARRNRLPVKALLGLFPAGFTASGCHPAGSGDGHLGGPLLLVAAATVISGKKHAFPTNR
ncbi:hypothetical protein [Nonomuraea rubra]|uniref:Uncharacterized protein n=1 Tax=Nonomuraea rubra TaxID=46180 RepID=A0A7X0TVN6_9ACTN|nr:hypothetical protein [Nonomuraea rubra]MBB6545458.1 hypothetical protein [Nonomuraea rubra]